jgi:hypothetical protein
MLRESATLWNYQNYWLVELTQTGLITTLRLLFARQAKGKRKLVLWDITSIESLVHADLIKHEQPELSLPVWINPLASDVCRRFRGICPSSGRFVPWDM